MGDKYEIKYCGKYKIEKIGYITPLPCNPRVKILDGLNNMQRYRKNNKNKIKARAIVFVELRAGRIKKQPCFVCGSLKTEAHHEDYNKPLDIIWVCKKHHIELDSFKK